MLTEPDIGSDDPVNESGARDTFTDAESQFLSVEDASITSAVLVRPDVGRALPRGFGKRSDALCSYMVLTRIRTYKDKPAWGAIHFPPDLSPRQ